MIIAPEMTQFGGNRGAKYQYSLDGGKTWQEEMYLKILTWDKNDIRKIYLKVLIILNQSEMST